jgi:hypothetical protein
MGRLIVEAEDAGIRLLGWNALKLLTQNAVNLSIRGYMR